MPIPPQLEYGFTLHVDLAPPLDFGSTISRDRRSIPITSSSISRPKPNGKIIPHSGGDWNAVRSDGVVHIYARYSIQADGGTMIGIINEGYGRANQETMKTVFKDKDPSSASVTNVGKDWYTRTSPKFELSTDNEEFQWLISSVFLGDLKPPTRQGYVEIDVYQVL
ncbi:uncharacterized protein TRUGW13939_11131 [Talaromyces rugulosus]|uniref:Uncharacterized protein n=1 Tax=Talaromyces rugulosus TaxID=121627 RepID=A0A7H8RBX1_TALRU|nr:uncharacterized protein TRUGW13939_11131 [Talaromyces rugulosus]QKX63959.1 hypothetical protein TRUGW13939_11131 [Talaromyces rugulosus]